MAEIPMDNTDELDGKNLVPLLTGSKTFDRQEIFWYYPHYHGSGWLPGAAIRQGDWKLITFYESQTTELYNLKDDISELNDLSKTYPNKALKLLNKLEELQKGGKC